MAVFYNIESTFIHNTAAASRKLSAEAFLSYVPRLFKVKLSPKFGRASFVYHKLLWRLSLRKVNSKQGKAEGESSELRQKLY